MWTYTNITHQYLLISINASLIICLVICNFVNMQLVRHPTQMNGENMPWEKWRENTEMNKASNFVFGISYLIYS